jgi:penicillin amidase
VIIVVAWVSGAVLAALVAALLVGWEAIRRSLPREAGVAHISALGAPVEAVFDSLGVPHLAGESLEDVAAAQGFVHAQERFFQMDLARRVAAGELAALVGAIAIDADRAARPAGARRLAERALNELPPRHRMLLEAYADGVNAGLADRRARPPEYFLLRARPEPWLPADTFLVLYYFFTGLSFNHRFEPALHVMHAALPNEVVRFLTPSTSRFDAPLVLEDDDATGGFVPSEVPPASVIDLRVIPRPSFPRKIVRPPLLAAGSNNWAVAGERTRHGGALLANDTHLPLQVPNTYYRVELSWNGRMARGVSVPGAPGVILGATDDLAWGATNALADQTDLVLVEADPDDPTRYRGPDGLVSFDRSVERIAVRGGDSVEVEIRRTRWGPIVAEDWRGRPLALRSTVDDDGGMNLAVVDLLTARSVDEGAAVLDRWTGPALNWLLADRAARIAWVVSGPLPMRRGFDGSRPVSWAMDAAGWSGRRAGPRLVDPPGGLLFTANNRTMYATMAAQYSRAWISPVRAYRIAALLRNRSGLTEHDLVEIQLDTRTPSHDAIRDLVLGLVDPGDASPALASARRHAQAWNGTADADQPGFRLLHAYYTALHEAVLSPLLAPAAALDTSFVYNWPLADEPLRRLLEARPSHLLPQGFADWPSFLRTILEETLADLTEHADVHALDTPWGEVNRAAIRHPFGGIPMLGRRLNMPSDPLSGWVNAVRATAPAYGATVRFVVSPLSPSRGLFQMPGGQSGHFLSPHYHDAHSGWVTGVPTAFQATAPRTRYRLEPGR